MEIPIHIIVHILLIYEHVQRHTWYTHFQMLVARPQYNAIERMKERKQIDTTDIIDKKN